MSGEQPRFELSVPQIAGGALAAVTAAVAASYLGVAGTFVGAAVASIASTIGGAVYTHYLKRANEQIKQHTVIAWKDREDTAPIHVDGEGELATAVQATVRPDEPHSDTLVMAPIERRRRIPWARLLAAAALVFTISTGVILAYQGVSGSRVDEQTRGARDVPAVEHHRAPQNEREDDAPVAPPTSKSPEAPSQTPTPPPPPPPLRRHRRPAARRHRRRPPRSPRRLPLLARALRARSPRGARSPRRTRATGAPTPIRALPRRTGSRASPKLPDFVGCRR
ncbi:hypothetical protein ACFQGX_30060 [Nonomuraea dietziae]|uniref:hypothetical protein n=1 Tax=Nonomuraea dietziae TaxID=65515 RepID=UPI003611AEE1